MKRRDEHLAGVADQARELMRARIDRELAEISGREPPPSCASDLSHVRPRTEPKTTTEICAEIVDALCQNRRCWIEGGTLIFKGGSIRQRVPIMTPGQVRTLIALSLNKHATDDLCNEILKFIGEQK